MKINSVGIFGNNFCNNVQSLYIEQTSPMFNFDLKPADTTDFSNTNSSGRGYWQNIVIPKISKALDAACDRKALSQISKQIDEVPDYCDKKPIIKKYADKYNEIYTGLAQNENYTPEEIFSKIFDREISEDEARELLNKYKSIISEGSFNIYFTKLLDEIKKDYGLDYQKIKLIYPAMPNGKLSVNAFMENDNKLFIINLSNNNPLKREKTFQMLFHELMHLKQKETAILTDKDKFAEAISERFELKKSKTKRMVNSQYKDILKHHKPYEKNSQEYLKGLEYIESWKTYIKPDENTEEYENLIIEKEAYEKSELAGILYYSIKQGKF